MATLSYANDVKLETDGGSLADRHIASEFNSAASESINGSTTQAEGSSTQANQGSNSQILDTAAPSLTERFAASAESATSADDKYAAAIMQSREQDASTNSQSVATSTARSDLSL